MKFSVLVVVVLLVGINLPVFAENVPSSATEALTQMLNNKKALDRSHANGVVPNVGGGYHTVGDVAGAGVPRDNCAPVRYSAPAGGYSYGGY